MRSIKKPVSCAPPNESSLIVHFLWHSNHAYKQSPLYLEFTVQSHTYQGTPLILWPRTRPATFIYDNYSDLTPKDPMEISTDSPTPAMPKVWTSNLVTELNTSKRVRHQATVEARMNSQSFGNALLEPVVTTSKGMASLFMQRVVPVRTVINANQDATSAVVKSDSDDTEQSHSRYQNPLLSCSSWEVRSCTFWQISVS